MNRHQYARVDAMVQYIDDARGYAKVEVLKGFTPAFDDIKLRAFGNGVAGILDTRGPRALAEARGLVTAFVKEHDDAVAAADFDAAAGEAVAVVSPSFTPEWSDLVRRGEAYAITIQTSDNVRLVSE